MGLVILAALIAASNTAPHPELGTIEWRRGYDEALAESARIQKPLFVLFDEVPGCSTVRSYGRRVLSHPLIKEAVETHFVPVAVYNNVGGDDRRVLQRFGEAAWNNPAVRILNAREGLLAPRLYGDYSVRATAQTMVRALEAFGTSVPEYLELLAIGAKTETATYRMYCFWSGEVALGGVEGVVRSEAGFGGGELVRVHYDPTRTHRDDLDAAAGKADATLVDGGDFRPSADDTKYQIRRSLFRFVPMTSTQASRVNSALGQGHDPLRFLSPRQRSLYAAIQKTEGRGFDDMTGKRLVAGVLD